MHTLIEQLTSTDVLKHVNFYLSTNTRRSLHWGTKNVKIGGFGLAVGIVGECFV